MDEPKERMARMRSRRREAGLVEWRAWVSPDEAAALTTAMEDLRQGKAPPTSEARIVVTFEERPPAAWRDGLKQRGLRWTGKEWEKRGTAAEALELQRFAATEGGVVKIEVEEAIGKPHRAF